MIALDMHVHLIGTDFKSHGCRVPSSWRRNLVFMFLRKYMDIDSRLSDLELDEIILTHLADSVSSATQIDGAVILANDGVYDEAGRLDERETQFMVSNDYVLEAASRYPFLYAGVSINPRRLDWRDEIEKAANGKAVLVKVIPNHHGIDWMDRRFLPFLRLLRDKSLPLLTHGGFEHVLKSPKQHLGDPSLLKAALEEGVCVIMAHSATSGIVHPFREYFGKWVDMLSKYPNLWGDLSAFCTVARKNYLKYFIKDNFLMSRALQGSDWPVPISPFLFLGDIPFSKLRRIRRIRNFFDRESELKLAAGVPRKVFYNAAEVLNISDKQASDTDGKGG
jgi:predicted TIM-barrel fold metal-dependent hydrolase